MGGVSKVAQASKLKTEFVSVASHQLRTPLTAFKWSTEELLSTELDKDQQPLAETLQEASQGMLKIVNNLLDVSRADSGRLKLDKRSVSLNEITDEVIENLTPLARARNVLIEFKKKDGEKFETMADKEKIKMVILNLIDNAIIYSHHPGKVEIAIAANNHQTTLSVKNMGVGIPRKEQPLIFKKFFRSENAMKYQVKDSGLGLFIARSFVKAHKGKIRFVSKENKETTFYISLPNK